MDIAKHIEPIASATMTVDWIKGSDRFHLLLTRIGACGFDSERHYLGLAACIERGWEYFQVENELDRKGKTLVYPGDELAARKLTKIAYDEASDEYKSFVRNQTEIRARKQDRRDLRKGEHRNSATGAISRGFDPNDRGLVSELPTKHW